MKIKGTVLFCSEVAKLTGLARKTVTNNAKRLREAGHAEYAGKMTTLYYPSAVEWLLKNVKPRVTPIRKGFTDENN